MKSKVKGGDERGKVIVDILKKVGIYERVREKVGSDADLVRLFNQNFDELILLVSK